MELCNWLRFKSLTAFPSLSEEQLAALYAADDVPYSCLQTCQAWGPDEDVASPEACTSARRCFKPSPRLRRSALS